LMGAVYCSLCSSDDANWPSGWGGACPPVASSLALPSGSLSQSQTADAVWLNSQSGVDGPRSRAGEDVSETGTLPDTSSVSRGGRTRSSDPWAIGSHCLRASESLNGTKPRNSEMYMLAAMTLPAAIAASAAWPLPARSQAGAVVASSPPQVGVWLVILSASVLVVMVIGVGVTACVMLGRRRGHADVELGADGRFDRCETGWRIDRDQEDGSRVARGDEGTLGPLDQTEGLLDEWCACRFRIADRVPGAPGGKRECSP
jgi:hypothetical protein